MIACIRTCPSIPSENPTTALFLHALAACSRGMHSEGATFGPTEGRIVEETTRPGQAMYATPSPEQLEKYTRAPVNQVDECAYRS
jgi:hypothetical protein